MTLLHSGGLFFLLMERLNEEKSRMRLFVSFSLICVPACILLPLLCILVFSCHIKFMIIGGQLHFVSCGLLQFIVDLAKASMIRAHENRCCARNF